MGLLGLRRNSVYLALETGIILYCRPFPLQRATITSIATNATPIKYQIPFRRQCLFVRFPFASPLSSKVSM